MKNILEKISGQLELFDVAEIKNYQNPQLTFAPVKTDLIRGKYFTSNNGKKMLNYVLAKYSFEKNDNNISDGITIKLTDFIKDMEISPNSKGGSVVAGVLSSICKKEYFIYINNAENNTYESYFPYKIEIDQNGQFIRFRFTEEFKRMMNNEDLRTTYVPLENTKKFKSIFSQRLYEYIISWESQKGKNGNYRNCWYVHINVEQYKKNVSKENKYERNYDFVKKAFTEPIKEINEKVSDFDITNIEFKKEGKKIAWILLTVNKKGLDSYEIVAPYLNFIKNTHIVFDNYAVYEKNIKKNYALFVEFLEKINEQEEKLNLANIENPNMTMVDFGKYKTLLIQVLINFHDELLSSKKWAC